MPLAVENLTPQSSDADIREAISQSIEQCIKEGKPQDQCAAMAYQYARDKTGKPLGREA